MIALLPSTLRRWCRHLPENDYNRSCEEAERVHPQTKRPSFIPSFRKQFLHIGILTLSHGKGVPSYDRIFIDAATASSESFLGGLFDDRNRGVEFAVPAAGNCARHIRRELCLSRILPIVIMAPKLCGKGRGGVVLSRSAAVVSQIFPASECGGFDSLSF